jgi:hypothetical protein
LYRELEKVKLTLFKGKKKGEVVEAWLKNIKTYAFPNEIILVTRRIGWKYIS